MPEKRPTLLDAVRAWDGRSDLPDEERRSGKFAFVSGALDNVRLRHFELPDANTTRLFRALERAVSGSGRETLYQLMRQHPAVENADALADRAAALSAEGVAEVARWIATNATDREPVKYALALLARCGSKEDADLITTFARHDEFTMFAAAAVERVFDDPLAAELEMAERVHGWGKVALVERIAARDVDREDVRAWLLRRGCANDILDEYLGYACATAGRLHEALAAETIDDELRSGACRIVNALLVGGPAEDINDYEQGVFVIEQLLRHLDGTTSLEELAFVSQLAGWAAKKGHPHIAGEAQAMLRGEAMRQRLREAFLRGDRLERYAAWEAAHGAGLDLWEDAFALAQQHPVTVYLYQWIAKTDDPMRLRRAIALAEEQLPHEAIATGPANELGFGTAFEPHFCLAVVLQELPKGGQYSARLVMTALRSPVVNNRNWAINVLKATPRKKWGAEVLATLHRTVRDECDDAVRERLQALLS